MFTNSLRKKIEILHQPAWANLESFRSAQMLRASDLLRCFYSNTERFSGRTDMYISHLWKESHVLVLCNTQTWSCNCSDIFRTFISFCCLLCASCHVLQVFVLLISWNLFGLYVCVHLHSRDKEFTFLRDFSCNSNHGFFFVLLTSKERKQGGKDCL